MKICVRCHEDCSNRPRVKDPDGRYICKACLEKALAAKRAAEQAAPPPPEDEPPDFSLEGDDDIFALDDVTDLSASATAVTPGASYSTVAAPTGGGSAATTQPCPTCGAAIPRQALVCRVCNARTGWDEKGRKAYAASQRRTRGGPSYAPLITFGAVSLGVLALTALVWNHSDAAALAVLLLAGYASVIYVVVVVCAFIDEVIHGVLSLCCSPYQIYWVFWRSENGWVMSLFGTRLLAVACLWVLSGRFGDEWAASP
ncbi:MAG: hypothetical protein KDA21_12255 [Phycisphaerales bacterium]|nr:hypothetical protein [Phycisphaerales bacterium]